MGASASIEEINKIKVINYSAFSDLVKINKPKDVIKRIDLQATFEKYKNATTDNIPLDIVKELITKNDLFLTHDWGVDELERDNHKRVDRLNKKLQDKGVVTWFDSEQMKGEVVEQMIRGIDNSQLVIVFVTKRYNDKINSSNANDNCKKEFNYAIRTKSASKIIPVVMEPRMIDHKAWTGLLNMELAGKLHIDSTSDDDIDAVVNHIIKEMNAIIKPLWVLKKDINMEDINHIEDKALVKDMANWFIEKIKIPNDIATKYGNILLSLGIGKQRI